MLQYLKENDGAKVDVLAAILGVSPVTIRRDIEHFISQGIVARLYGGAKLVGGVLNDEPLASAEVGLSDHARKLALQKQAIARYAASLIEDRDTLFINSSSTALLVLKYLEDKQVVVITNNGKALQLPEKPSVEIVLTGGELSKHKQSMVGEFATYILSKVTATKCFLGVSGISAEGGFTTSVLQETVVNQMMLKRCTGPRIVLADSSKVGREHNFLTGEISNISCLITDSGADPQQLDLLRDKGVDVVVVDPLDKLD